MNTQEKHDLVRASLFHDVLRDKSEVFFIQCNYGNNNIANLRFYSCSLAEETFKLLQKEYPNAWFYNGITVVLWKLKSLQAITNQQSHTTEVMLVEEESNHQAEDYIIGWDKGRPIGPTQTEILDMLCDLINIAKHEPVILHQVNEVFQIDIPNSNISVASVHSFDALLEAVAMRITKK